MEKVETLNQPEERLSKRNLWGYSMGGIGRDMVYQLVNTALMTYILMTRNVTTEMVTVIGIIFLVCRIFDGCNDPLMGAIIERTRTRFGKFKPWMMIGVFTNIIVICLLFFVNLEGWDYVIFFGFMYLLWGITYTMNDISYWGMMPSLTSNPTDRNNLSTLANIGAGVGAGLAIGATTLFTSGSTQIGGNAITAYRVIAGVICGIFAICQTMTFFVVKEKPLPPLAPRQKGEGTGLMRIFKVIFHNDQLLAIAGTMLCYNIGAATMLLFTSYWVWLRYGYIGLLVTIFSLLTACSSVIIVVYPILSKKLTREKIAKISFIAILTGYSIMLIIGLITGATLEKGSKADFICFFFIAISGAIAFFGQTLYYQVQTISIANTVEYNDWKTGSRDEGAIFAVRPFMAKMGSAICVLIQTIGLAAIGITELTNKVSELENAAYKDTTGWYDAENALGTKNILDSVMSNKDVAISDILNNPANFEGVANNPDQWLLVLMTVIPMLFIIVSYIIYRKKYNITEEKYNMYCAEIAARNANKSEDAEVSVEEVIVTETEEPGIVVEPAVAETTDENENK